MKEVNLDHNRGYWGQVADTLAEWLGVEHLTTLDMAILLFLLAIGIVLFLPWERWSRKDILTPMSGFYGLYCSFVCWHFHLAGWLVLLFALVGIGVVLGALKGYPITPRPGRSQ